MESHFESPNKHIDHDDQKQNEDDQFQEWFQELIPTLPKSNGWGLLEHVFQYQGFWLHPSFLRGVVLAQQQFQARPTDIILCGAPKSGSTWLKSLAFAIVTRTSFDDSTTPLLSNLSHKIIPFMEVDRDHFSTHRDLGIPFFSTHVPFPSLPRSIIDSGCKIVYVCRDPKDSFVSLYHFMANIITSRKGQPLNLDEALELFCEGKCFYGPQWDHILGYWKASLELPDKILFSKYEEMSDDTMSFVKKLAEFIGHPFSSEELQKGVPEKIIKLCSFENLSNLEVNKNGMHRAPEIKNVVENKNYFRKGKVGDWKNHLTPEMAARLDQITLQKLNGSGLNL